jgi:hypothetical protein
MPAQKIKQLTIEQQALVSSYRKKWESSIFSTKRITQRNVEQVVTDIYTYLGKTLPEFIFLPCPSEALEFLWEKENLEISTNLMRLLENLTVHLFEVGLIQRGETPLSGLFLENLSLELYDQKLDTSLGKNLDIEIISIKEENSNLIYEQLEDSLWDLELQFQSQDREDYLICQNLEKQFIERITIQIDRRFQEMGNTSPWQDIDLELDKTLCHTWQGNWRDDLKNALKEIYFYKLNTSIRPRREVGNASFMDFCTSVLGCTFNQHSWNI